MFKRKQASALPVLKSKHKSPRDPGIKAAGAPGEASGSASVPPNDVGTEAHLAGAPAHPEAPGDAAEDKVDEGPSVMDEDRVEEEEEAPERVRPRLTRSPGLSRHLVAPRRTFSEATFCRVRAESTNQKGARPWT